MQQGRLATVRHMSNPSFKKPRSRSPIRYTQEAVATHSTLLLLLTQDYLKSSCDLMMNQKSKANCCEGQILEIDLATQNAASSTNSVPTTTRDPGSVVVLDRP
jgi:hypothetical protein